MATTQLPIHSLANGTSPHTPSTQYPIELAFPIPNSLGTTLHLQITNTPLSLLIFIATRNQSDANSGPASLGSFVYAMPDAPAASGSADSSMASSTVERRQPLATTLYSRTQTVDFTTRLAKVLAARCGKPVYVGGEVGFGGMGRGGDVEEEMVVFRGVVDVVLGVVQGAR